MSSKTSQERLSTGSLIFIPFLISMGITALRLYGELRHWPSSLFSREAGGGGAIVGITWLAPIFGIYFALKLSAAGEGMTSAARAILASVGSIAVLFVGILLFAPRPKPFFPGAEIVGYLLAIGAMFVPSIGWRKLTTVLLAYGCSVRIPIAILMYFAIRGQWGTHYDVTPPSFPKDLGFWSTYVHIALLPQLIFWVAFTITIGSLFGSIVAAIAHRSSKSREAHAV